MALYGGGIGVPNLYVWKMCELQTLCTVEVLCLRVDVNGGIGLWTETFGVRGGAVVAIVEVVP
jgi:hypothetical protein